MINKKLLKEKLDLALSNDMNIKLLIANVNNNVLLWNSEHYYVRNAIYKNIIIEFKNIIDMFPNHFIKVIFDSKKSNDEIFIHYPRYIDDSLLIQ